MKTVFAGALLFVVFISGCATHTGNGLLITAVTEAHSATSNPRANKIGKACSYNILGLVAVGDASIDTAKKNGKIKKVSSVDREIFSILIFYGQNCTVVKGS